jgi:predicted nucleic acid-binding protein
MDAFDADALIYAAVAHHPLGRRVATLFSADSVAGIGSVLLLPEVLTKPVRSGDDNEVRSLTWLLARLDLRPLDSATAEVAVALGVAYRLRAADAAHLATAVQVGADRFITNNRRHFPRTISAISVTYPEDLPDPAAKQRR